MSISAPGAPVAPHIRAPSTSASRHTSHHSPDPDVDPILSRSLLALAVGVALILLSIALAPPA